MVDKEYTFRNWTSTDVSLVDVEASHKTTRWSQPDIFEHQFPPVTDVGNGGKFIRYMPLFHDELMERKTFYTATRTFMKVVWRIKLSKSI